MVSLVSSGCLALVVPSCLWSYWFCLGVFWYLFGLLLLLASVPGVGYLMSVYLLLLGLRSLFPFYGSSVYFLLLLFLSLLYWRERVFLLCQSLTGVFFCFAAFVSYGRSYGKCAYSKTKHVLLEYDQLRPLTWLSGFSVSSGAAHAKG